MSDKVQTQDSSLTSEKGLMSYQDAAEFIGMSKSWLEKRVSQKEVPHLKIGRSVRFEMERLTKWWKKFRSH